MCNEEFWETNILAISIFENISRKWYMTLIKTCNNLINNMEKINLKTFKKDEVALMHLANVQGGSGAGSATSVLYTYCILSDSDYAWWYGDSDN